MIFKRLNKFISSNTCVASTFELFNDSNLNKIYCCGIDAENIKKRLLIAGIDEAKIVTAADIPSIKSDVLADKVDAVCGVLNCDYCAPFDETFGGGEH